MPNHARMYSPILHVLTYKQQAHHQVSYQVLAKDRTAFHLHLKTQPKLRAAVLQLVRHTALATVGSWEQLSWDISAMIRDSEKHGRLDKL